MLTIDDCNTILEKYKDASFFYEIDLSKISDKSDGKKYLYDFCEITFSTHEHYNKLATVKIINLFGAYPAYLKANDGGYVAVGYAGFIDYKKFTTSLNMPGPYESQVKIIGLYICKTTIPDYNIRTLSSFKQLLFLPLSPLQIPVINGEFDNKFYIDVVGSRISSYMIDGEVVSLQSDDKGYYLELPDTSEHILGTTYDNEEFPLYRVNFKEFKSLPTLSIPSLYKGTPQEIKLYNEDTEEYITEFQAYYQGRKLKDNIITLDYDVDDTVDIVVDILDPAYPPSRVKLKASTIYYVARTQAELETAITNGIKTVMVTNHQQPTTRAVNEYVLLTSMELTDLNLINSDIHLTDCTVDNVNIISTTFKDKGDNKFNDCKFQETTITSTGNPSKYNDCIITECTVTATELRLTGAITNTTLSNSLIISDGIIEVIGNTFTGKNSKDYFPSFLYLTGDYLAKNNTFTLNDEWTEPAFNMCIIKSIDTFNPSLFIAENTFHLNIEYSTEEPNTFYYNIVDDDKIKAKRLS